MKFIVPTAVLLFLPGIAASTYAQPGRGQDGHPQASGQAQQQARPVQEQQRPAQLARPAARQQTRNAMPPQQQHIQQARRSQSQPPHPVGLAHPGLAGLGQVRGQQSGHVGESAGANQHGRISNAHYSARFGSGHSFHIRGGDYDRRRFQYGGYGFGFIDPWPMGWGYSDDVYVEYTDDGYFMYNRFHPGVRISINIL